MIKLRTMSPTHVKSLISLWEICFETDTANYLPALESTTPPVLNQIISSSFINNSFATSIRFPVFQVHLSLNELPPLCQHLINLFRNIGNKSWYSYLIKVSQYRNVEGNPQFDCKDYSLDDTYGNCIRKNFERQFIEILNCTPPWIPSSQMCNKRLRLNDRETKTLVNQLLYPKYVHKKSKL